MLIIFLFNFRDLYKKFSDIYFVRDRTAPLRIPETFAPKVLSMIQSCIHS